MTRECIDCGEVAVDISVGTTIRNNPSHEPIGGSLRIKCKECGKLIERR